MRRAQHTMHTEHSTELERGDLLATKLHMPRLRQGFMPRPRVRARLAHVEASELTLVCTPPGFGKTTLLVDWARQHDHAVRWLALDIGDNDPARFWQYVAAAIEPDCVGLPEQLAPLLGTPGGPPLEAVVARVVNALAAQPEPVVLVLDDYHVIESPVIHQSLGLLLDRLPAQLRLVIASRADPPLQLARLRARAQLGELRAIDLRFTLDEAAEFVRLTTGGLELDSGSLEALVARTEGWVAGLQLASLSMQHSPDPAQFVATFSGSHRYVLDFLTEEVLAGQPEHRVNFLLETSVLERLSAPVCDAVTATSNSLNVLEEIERANLFLIALDDVRRWWRYHHLFAELLRARLQRLHPERVSDLHRRAAGWFEAHGLVDEALHHARAAGDFDWVADLVEKHAQAQLMRSEIGTVQRWLAALPPGLIRERPRLGVTGAVWALIGGDTEHVAPLLADAEQAYAARATANNVPDVDRAMGHANVPAMLGILHAELARQRGDAQQTLDYARDALAYVRPDDRFLKFLVHWNTAVATLMQGEAARAEPVLREILADRRSAGDAYNALRACFTLGQAQRARGSLRTARRTAELALALVQGPLASPEEPPIAGIARLGLAEVLREQGELDAALEHATRGAELVQHIGYAQWVVTGLSILGAVQQARGELTAADAALARAEACVPQTEDAADLIFPVAVQRARLWLTQGAFDAVAEWAERYALSQDGEPSFARERHYLVLVRLLIAQGTPERCLGLLARLESLAEAQGRGGSLIELTILHALALAAVGDDASAVEKLTRALAAAGPEGYIRVFVDEGPSMLVLLDRLADQLRGNLGTRAGVSAEYVARLRDSCGPAPREASPSNRRPTVTGPVRGLVDPLSDREMDVLRLLADGKSNQEIADALVVALDTVKKHVSHILGKLQATSRTQAVARARQIALLD
jgi:LuxR family transcriptional regulator, maltose regulon positive regulatory protein